MLTRTLLLALESDRAQVRSRVEAALAIVNDRCGVAFADDGAMTEDGITCTVWTDDPDGETETSWVRLTDDPRARSLSIDVNATDESIFDALVEQVGALALTREEIDAAVSADLRLTVWMGLEERAFDAKSALLIETALSSHDEATRGNAALALCMLKWSQLVPSVEKALARAGSSHERAVLEAILRASPNWRV